MFSSGRRSGTSSRRGPSARDFRLRAHHVLREPLPGTPIAVFSVLDRLLDDSPPPRSREFVREYREVLLLDGPAWPAFGHVAAEAELHHASTPLTGGSKPSRTADE